MQRLISFLLFPAGFLMGACGSDSPGVADGNGSVYTSDPDKTVVIGGTGAQPSATCVTLPSGECVDAKTCEAGERRDVVIDSGGKVVAVVCYPANATPVVVESEGDVTVGKTENNRVIAIDGANDGVDVAGDLDAESNNVVIYGSGADVSVIGGNVTSSGNNFSLRGVTVKKDVHVIGNNATLVLCVVEGDVILEGNNNVVAECAIRGKVDIHGVNNVLIRNKIGGGVSFGSDKNTVCDENTIWNDSNGNMIVDIGESDATLTCGSSK